MKNFFKVVSIIALAAVIVFTMAACGDGSGDDGGGGGGGGGTPVTPTTYSLNGVWGNSSGTAEVTVSGNSGILTKYTTTDALWNDAITKGYLKVGTTQYWRNLTSTGTLTWSGQVFTLWGSASNLNVVTNTTYENRTLTMSADGQTVTVKDSSGNVTSTWTRKSPSLDGVWMRSENQEVTISGSIGILTKYNATENNAGALTMSAITNGYIQVGTTQWWRNIASTGNLTWSGQRIGITFNTSSPNVATGTEWISGYTFTMSSNGQTLTVNGPTSSDTSTWTRK